MKKSLTDNCLIVLSTLSIICAIVSLFIGSLFLSLLGIPGIFVISSFFHEMGHMIACFINGNKITKIRVYFLEFSEGKIKLRDKFRLDSSCSFIRSRNDAIVYLGGPIVSFLLTFILLIVGILTQRQVWFIFFEVFLLRLFRNILTKENNDINNAINENRKSKTRGCNA